MKNRFTFFYLVLACSFSAQFVANAIPYPGDPRDLDPKLHCKKEETEITCDFIPRDQTKFIVSIGKWGLWRDDEEAKKLCERFMADHHYRKVADYLAKGKWRIPGSRTVRLCHEDLNRDLKKFLVPVIGKDQPHCEKPYGDIDCILGDLPKAILYDQDRIFIYNSKESEAKCKRFTKDKKHFMKLAEFFEKATSDTAEFHVIRYCAK